MDQYVHIPETLRDNKKLPVPMTNSENYVITFQHVSFRYPGQKVDALKDVNVSIHAGTKLSVVGENGAGKTTFVKLLCRLYDPTEGEILFNGVNIRDIDYDQYMAIFSAVFQDYKLFSFSIRDNIALNQGKSISNHRIMQLLQKVGLSEKIDKLPQGIDTIVYKEFDKKGFELSGGKAQKLAIARAIARDSKIVILDEPLAALDPKAEHEIFEQFADLVGQKTAIYISHRLSSSKACDSILVFQNGRIIESGTHDDLIQLGGKYAELFALQANLYLD
ncbi:MAG: ABC transporter ATP-binding protein/permease [Ruminococcus sp.]|nr:ABC transporter ATP-binding protein/permease [Ruminococcus sp.]